MTVDPTDPDTFEEDGDFGEPDAEIPERDDAPAEVDPARVDEANEADLAEQARVVALDEDDYRY